MSPLRYLPTPSLLVAAGTSVLGAQVQNTTAQKEEHFKFDPISQEDYYALFEKFFPHKEFPHNSQIPLRDFCNHPIHNLCEPITWSVLTRSAD
jgi:hypothetical protein